MRNEETYGLHLRRGIWYIHKWHNGTRIRQSLHTSDLAIAKSARDALIEKITVPPQRGMLPASYGLPASTAELWQCIVRCREAALARDRKRGRLPTLSSDDLRAIYVRSGSRCELTGISFSLQSLPGKMRRPFAPSLDRLNNSEPYTMANTRLICVAANIALNEWGEGVFRRLAVGFLTNHEGNAGTFVATADERQPDMLLQMADS